MLGVQGRRVEAAGDQAPRSLGGASHAATRAGKKLPLNDRRVSQATR